MYMYMHITIIYVCILLILILCMLHVCAGQIAWPWTQWNTLPDQSRVTVQV